MYVFFISIILWGCESEGKNLKTTSTTYAPFIHQISEYCINTHRVSLKDLTFESDFDHAVKYLMQQEDDTMDGEFIERFKDSIGEVSILLKVKQGEEEEAKKIRLVEFMVACRLIHRWLVSHDSRYLGPAKKILKYPQKVRPLSPRNGRVNMYETCIAIMEIFSNSPDRKDMVEREYSVLIPAHRSDCDLRTFIGYIGVVTMALTSTWSKPNVELIQHTQENINFIEQYFFDYNDYSVWYYGKMAAYFLLYIEAMRFLVIESPVGDTLDIRDTSFRQKIFDLKNIVNPDVMADIAKRLSLVPKNHGYHHRASRGVSRGNYIDGQLFVHPYMN